MARFDGRCEQSAPSQSVDRQPELADRESGPLESYTENPSKEASEKVKQIRVSRPTNLALGFAI
jgi:hypothetical protein